MSARVSDTGDVGRVIPLQLPCKALRAQLCEEPFCPSFQIQSPQPRISLYLLRSCFLSALLNCSWLVGLNCGAVLM